MRDEWDELFVGIDAVAELPRLEREWLCGLGAHPSPDVVTRLVGRVRHLPAYPLPAEAVDAVIAHPDWRLRADLAEHQRGMSLAQ
ncbi:hypothetical protein [Kitasatospora terrestris]|uniref:Uncharacterized protein n=1 Tax=Kitasatospora terrestris TaxID=258051 RepID=A0ABP9DG72_9ACTN